ncbi:FkbM family methyltransferase [Pedobacter sp. 22163]|uniref:FkbM family methyltransferase n=1 Tax=Pedobacter sp. 22163 TaxID=3453883 RepID=UPI003F858C5C
MKKSFSQCGEDIIVNYIFEQIGITRPSYLDIGAHHPFYLNNTQMFYEKGCVGINIEPDPSLFKLFPKYRKRDLNLNYGIGATEGELELNVMSSATLNTFSSFEANRFQTDFGFKIETQVMIKIQTIKSILDKYQIYKFPDFLSIDIEGLEEEVIKSIDFNEGKPIVICLETISYSETGRGEKNHDIISYLENQGYIKYADTNVNTIFVLKEKWERD